MKKPLMLLAILTLLATVACTQKTETEVDREGAVTSTETTTYPGVDTAATAEAANDVQDATRDAAHATGTAMETAGQEIQEETRTST